MNKTFSIEDGFQIVMLYLQEFWFKSLKQKMLEERLINEDFKGEIGLDASAEEKHKNSLHYRNWYFFVIVCDGTSPDYFEKVIEDRMHLPPVQQSGIQVKEELLFQLMIDFCQYVNLQFAASMENSLKFAINWLEKIRKKPEEHQTELKIWNDVVINVTEHGARSAGFF